MAWGRSGFEPSGLDRPGRLPHQQGLCEVRLGCQDESGRKDSEGLQVFFLRAQGHGSQEEDEEDGSEYGQQVVGAPNYVGIKGRGHDAGGPLGFRQQSRMSTAGGPGSAWRL